MLRYRVAYDQERGHFVLPALPAVIPFEETFASRHAAQKIAQARNNQAARSTNQTSVSSSEVASYPQTVLRGA